MDDLTLAKERLYSSDKRLVVAQGGRILTECDEPGIAATLGCLEEVRRLGAGFAVADRVVGRAAAWAALWAGAEACYGEVVSRPAEGLLAGWGLRVEAGRRVEAILNRARNGPCPLEAAVAEARDPEEAVEMIRRLLLAPKT